jgi:uncharacterized membrane protein YqgA involved in biofilm formation
VIGTGTLINCVAILLGGILGMTLDRRLTLKHQLAIKGLLGALVVYAGLSTTWGALHGTFGQVLKQGVIMLFALMLGNAIGRLLRLQRGMNRVGQYARDRFTASQTDPTNRFSEGFVTCTLLFCIGPMAILGSLQDGLTGHYRTLALKGAMDGLATMGFVGTFGWGPVLAVIPVLAYQGTLTVLARSLEPFLQNQMLVDSINVTGGMLVFCTALIILDLKKIELANYLPSLAFAPLLTWWLK